MKKGLCFILVLFFLFTIVGCSLNRTNRASILGCWETEIELSILGVSLPDNEENQTVNATYRLEFYEDGTGKRIITVDEKYASQIPDVNESFTYTHNGDKLELIQENGNTQVFTVSFSDEKLHLNGRAHLELTRKK